MLARPIGNTVHMDDYPEINLGVEAIKHSANFFQQRGVVIEIPHHHRYWEYGTAVQMLLDRYGINYLDSIEVLDVGAGWGGVGPAMALLYNTSVTECEPLEHCREDRKKCNKVLSDLGKKQITVLDNDLFKLPKKKYDAVFCISVLEHVTKIDEPYAWFALIDHVKPGGVLYITCDCMDNPEAPHQFDNLRNTNYDMKALEFRVNTIKNMGFKPMGEPNYHYNGNQVFDYSFFRVGFVREA